MCVQHIARLLFHRRLMSASVGCLSHCRLVSASVGCLSHCRLMSASVGCLSHCRLVSASVGCLSHCRLVSAAVGCLSAVHPSSLLLPSSNCCSYSTKKYANTRKNCPQVVSHYHKQSHYWPVIGCSIWITTQEDAAKPRSPYAGTEPPPQCSWRGCLGRYV